MTGHGESHGQNDRIGLTVEVRSVNNRHLKLSVRCPDAFLALEANIDRLVRSRIARGSVSISLKVRYLGDSVPVTLNHQALAEYWRQLTEIAASLGTQPPADLTSLLGLSGIVEETEAKSVEESDWPLFESVIGEALDHLDEFRQEEGRSMQSELESLASSIETHLGTVAKLAPDVVVSYRDRLKDRINELIRESNLQVDESDLIREVSLFADRCDITEEITRLKSHLSQQQTLLSAETSAGRKLDFLGQEMFRELNTIGSKSNDVRISHLIVDMKASIEKMREIVQNIE